MLSEGMAYYTALYLLLLAGKLSFKTMAGLGLFKRREHSIIGNKGSVFELSANLLRPSQYYCTLFLAKLHLL